MSDANAASTANVVEWIPLTGKPKVPRAVIKALAAAAAAKVEKLMTAKADRLAGKNARKKPLAIVVTSSEGETLRVSGETSLTKGSLQKAVELADAATKTAVATDAAKRE